MSAPATILPGWCAPGRPVALTRSGSFVSVAHIARLSDTMVILDGGRRFRRIGLTEIATTGDIVRLKPLTDDLVIITRSRRLLRDLAERVTSVSTSTQDAKVALARVEALTKMAHARLADIEAGLA